MKSPEFSTDRGTTPNWPDALLQVDDAAGWLALTDRVAEYAASEPGEVSAVIERVERDTRDRGWHAAGFVAFEAGAAFGLAAHSLPRDLPLAWFGAYRAARPLERLPVLDTGFSVGPIEPSVDRVAFERAIGRIHDHLKDGDTYQVNFTFPLAAAFAGDPRALWLALVRAQRCRYGAFVRCGGYVVCSASPELFFARDGDRLTSRPMKGTAPRGRTAAEDDANAQALSTSAKTRAENVMIVDMARNDLGRVADVGSVQVAELCAMEPYPTLLQLVSTVTARSRASLAEIFAAMHPAASVTGALKVRTMEIIASLESRPRGVYTGAIGLIRPDGRAHFNVGIRTAVVDEARATLTFGVGAGIDTSTPFVFHKTTHRRVQSAAGDASKTTPDVMFSRAGLDRRPGGSDRRGPLRRPGDRPGT
ncbi:MAG TPA: chorismate-binding protein [Vicinamibacterales bacterium]|nr:chorismate-binding protein [Vicinamibacterales bacterium]